jgi:hypothetical protein
MLMEHYARTFKGSVQITDELKNIVDDFGVTSHEAIFAVRNDTIEGVWFDPLHNYIATVFTKASGDAEDCVLINSIAQSADATSGAVDFLKSTERWGVPLRWDYAQVCLAISAGRDSKDRIHMLLTMHPGGELTLDRDSVDSISMDIYRGTSITTAKEDKAIGALCLLGSVGVSGCRV